MSLWKRLVMKGNGGLLEMSATMWMFRAWRLLIDTAGLL